MALKRTAAQEELARSDAKRFCANRECGNEALAWHRLCEACYERSRAAQTMTWLEANGLRTVEDCREYCRRMVKKVFGPPSFERWAVVMTQKTVDILVLHDGPGDQRALERLRSIGAIDEQNRLVPLEERAARRAAIEAQARAERERVAAELAAQGVVRT